MFIKFSCLILEAKHVPPIFYLPRRKRTGWIRRVKEMEMTSIDLKRDGMGIEDLSGRVHQLPCCVKHDGPASISQYFKPKPTLVSDEGLPLQQAHFRGRLLHGTTLPLPNGYSGTLSLSQYIFLVN